MKKHIVLAGAPIFIPRKSHHLIILAARELARYLEIITGKKSQLVHQLPTTGTALIINDGTSNIPDVDDKTKFTNRESFRIYTGKRKSLEHVVISTGQPKSCLWGCYSLLEKLGVGFYLGGDTFPDKRTDAILPSDFDVTSFPAFPVRGNLLHDNTLVGITTWGLSDWKSYLNQLVRMRCNTLMLISYNNDYEPWDGSIPDEPPPKPIMSTLTKPWGAGAALPTSQFSFGTGDFFEEKIFSSPAGETLKDPLLQRQETIRVFTEAIDYARFCGVDVAAGLITPVGDVNNPTDPTIPAVQERFKTRLRRYVSHFPKLTYFVLCDHESAGCSGTALPTSVEARNLYDREYNIFAYLGNPRRIWEAIRFKQFALMTYKVLQEVAPRMRLILTSWGGDRWMRFADYCLGYDKTLPDEVIFSCFEYDASLSTTVSDVWGKLPQNRERWAIPWVEVDGSDLWSPQPNVESLRHLCPDALRKGCQGLLTMQWRTRDMEEETTYAARFAWDTSLTAEKFYHQFASDAFGPEHADMMAKRLLQLQRLGERWTGVHGTPEIGEMVFTGYQPHIPFEFNSTVPDYLLTFAKHAVEALSKPFIAKGRIPAGTDVAFFQQQFNHDNKKKTLLNVNWIGVPEFKEICERLQRLHRENNTERLRAEIKTMIELAFEARSKLILQGMTPEQFSAVDMFWLIAHHLSRNAGMSDHMQTLQYIRADLQNVGNSLVSAGRLRSMERMNYLAATIDFATHYDGTAVLLAFGETVPSALQKCERYRHLSDNTSAEKTAARAYERLISAGMQDAVIALTRKLTTRCAFGVLATVNIKPVAAYWKFIERLESFMPACPPREIEFSMDEKTFLLSWRTVSKGSSLNTPVSFHVYRTDVISGTHKRLTPKPIHQPVFIDKPCIDGHYLYTVTAIAGNGWESPHSHPVDVYFCPPMIVAPKPVSILEANSSVRIRATVVTHQQIKNVRLHYKTSDRWHYVNMIRRFRNSYESFIPGKFVKPGSLFFFVSATDISQQTTYWPETALLGQTWSATVL
ncbi:MAG: hypothetical protein M1501_01705 [Candidatus Omnitrophica bacterium]|nr:hypothetical protein [Candidatus Omnitrophota bacterium]